MGSELFSLDKNGKKTDAELHAQLLANKKAEAFSDEMAKKAAAKLGVVLRLKETK